MDNLQPMNCPNCGLEAQPTQKFCGRCGTPLSTPVAAQATTVLDSGTSTVPGIPTAHPVPATQMLSDFLPQAPTGPIYPQYPDYQQYPQQLAAPPPARTRSRLPLFIAIGALIIIIPVVALVALLTRPVAPTDPEAILKQATANMSQVKTLHYKSEVGFFGVDSTTTGISDTQPLTITLNGDISLPGSFTLDANIAQLGHQITISDTTWRRESGGDPWVSQYTSDASLGLINPLSFTSYFAYAQSGTAQLISSEKQGDTTLSRVRFKVDTALMAAAANDLSTRQTLTNSRISVDAWVNNDNRIERMTLSVEMESGTGVILRTTFSNYNGIVSIKPPN